MINKTLPIPVILAGILISILPMANLFAWENFTLFNTALTHRIWIIGCEIIAIAILLIITPFNILEDIKKYPKLAWPIMLLCFFGFFSCLFSENIYASLARHSEIIIHFFFIYILSKQASNHLFHNILIAGLFFSFLYTIFHFSLLRLAVGPAAYNWITEIPFFSNIRHWGYLQVLILPLSYYLILKSNSRVKITGYILFFLAWVSIVFSGGRGSFIASLFTCIVFAPLLLKLSKKVYSISILLALLAVFTAYQIEANNYSLSVKRLFFITQVNYDSGFDLNRTSSSRIGIYKDTLREVFEDSPLLGMGPDNYRYSLSLQYHVIPTHPHSLPIQFIYEYGLIGALLILIFIFNRLKHGVMLNNSLKKSAFLSLACCLIASLVDGNFYHSYSLFNISIILAILFSNSTTEKKDYKTNTNKTPAILLLTPALCIWGAHFFTFYQFTSPLESQDQIDNIKIFPSISAINLWRRNSNNQDLYEQALIHGGQWSDGQCAYYKLRDMLYPEIEKNRNYIDCKSKNRHHDQ